MSDDVHKIKIKSLPVKSGDFHEGIYIWKDELALVFLIAAYEAQKAR